MCCFFLRCFCKGDTSKYLEKIQTKDNFNFLAVFCQYVEVDMDYG